MAPREPLCVLAGRLGGTWRPRRDALARRHGRRLPERGRSRCGVVADLHPQERVACFGDRPLTLRAYVTGSASGRSMHGRGGCRLPPRAPRGSPIGGRIVLLAPTRARRHTIDRRPAACLRVRTAPCRHRISPPGAMVDLGGAFDHPAARDCRPGPTGPGAEPLTTSVARLSCRARFVVTRIAVEGARLSDVRRRLGVTVTDELRVRSDPGPDRGSATSCFRPGRESGSSMGRSSRRITNGSRSSLRRSTSVTACLASVGWRPRSTARSHGSQRADRGLSGPARRSTSRTSSG